MRTFAHRGDSGGATVTMEPEPRVAPAPVGQTRTRLAHESAGVGRARTGRALGWGVALGVAAFLSLLLLPESLHEIVLRALVGTGVFALLGVAVLSTQVVTVTLNAASALGIFAWALTGAAATPWGLAAHGAVWACNAWLARSDETVPSHVSAASSAAYTMMALLTWVVI